MMEGIHVRFEKVHSSYHYPIQDRRVPELFLKLCLDSFVELRICALPYETVYHR